ncbi:IS1096 element passenger TnpR family protein [Sphingomonas melonis]|uniref:IS1096 element passenger TnpR family protein n=1 Tax=Sphingomonas melonis TaxID=152682 RepID=UPI00359C449A
MAAYELFREAMSDPTHEEHQQLRQWHGSPFNPNETDELAAKRAVASIAIR